MILFYVADIRYREGSKHSAIFSLNVDGKFLDIIEEYAVEKKNSELKVVEKATGKHSLIFLKKSSQIIKKRESL